MEVFALPARNFEAKYFSQLRLLHGKWVVVRKDGDGGRGNFCVCVLRTWALSSCSFACARQLPKKREKKIVKLHLLHFVFL